MNDIKIGSMFTKGDWTIEILKFDAAGDARVRVQEIDDILWIEKKYLESITTWIKPKVTISREAAEEISSWYKELPELPEYPDWEEIQSKLNSMIEEK